MTGDHDFRARLDRLSGDEPQTSKGRIILRVGEHDSDVDAVLRALLQTIDDTILPSRLDIGSDSSSTLSLSVAARRLKAVEAASNDLDPGDLVGRQFDPDQTSHHADLKGLVRRFAEATRGAISVIESRTSGDGGSGLSVRQLTDDWGPQPDDSALPPAERFTSRCGQRLLACLISSPDGQARLLGDTTLEDTLNGVFQAIQDRQEEPAVGPTLTLWLRYTGSSDGHAFGFASWPSTEGPSTDVVLALRSTDAAAISSIFQSTQSTR